MNAHVEIRIRLNLKNGTTLHDILRQFARKSKGWKFPLKSSRLYQKDNRQQAGFILADSVEGLERAVVAIANLDSTAPQHFRVPNIFRPQCGSLTMDQYNAIGMAFAASFRQFLRQGDCRGIVDICGPEKRLSDIIKGAKCRALFESWFHTPTPLGHPSDLYVLNCFICHLFRHPGTVRTYELEPYLVQDRDWNPEAAREAVARIETGLELLRVDRKF